MGAGILHQGHDMRVRTKTAFVNVEVEKIVFTVEQITLGDINLAQEKHTVIKKGSTKTDFDKVGRDMFVQRVTAWVGDMTDENGKEFKCTPGNKALIWKYDNNFAGEIMTAANKALEAREDLETKNS